MFSRMPPSTISSATPEIPVMGSVTPGRPFARLSHELRECQLRRWDSAQGRRTQWWTKQLRKPPREAVPNLMKLQFEASVQLRTSTFSQMKSGLSDLGQMASSSESMVQFSISTFFESMSMPSLLKFACE